jgi:ABC-type sugar transport system substrate-binding protein
MTMFTPKSVKATCTALALAVACSLAPGFAAPAEAKKFVIVKKVFHHSFHHRRYYGPALLVAGAGVYAASHSCHWLKVRAINSGRTYWWNRYNDCIGE